MSGRSILASVVGTCLLLWAGPVAADPPERVPSDGRSPAEGPRRVPATEPSDEASAPRRGVDSPREVRRTLEGLARAERDVQRAPARPEQRQRPARAPAADDLTAGLSPAALALQRRASALLEGLLGDATQAIDALPTSPRSRASARGRAASRRAQQRVADLRRLLEAAAPETASPRPSRPRD